MKKIFIMISTLLWVVNIHTQDMQKQFIHIKDLLLSAQSGVSLIAQNSSALAGVSEKIPGMLSVPVSSVVAQINEALKTVQEGWFRDLVAKFTNLSDLEPFLVKMRNVLQALIPQLQIVENELVLCAQYLDPKSKQVLFLVKEISSISDALRDALKAFDPMVKNIEEMISSLKSLGLL